MAPDRTRPATAPVARSGASPDLIAACRSRMRDRGLTTSSPAEEVAACVRDVLFAGGSGRPDETLIADALAHLIGWGPLQELFDDPQVEEIWWNDPGRIYYAVGGVTHLSNILLARQDAEAMVHRAIRDARRRLDTTRPFADADLPDGSRLHVVIPPVTREHWAVNIRRYVIRPSGLGELVRQQMITADAADLLVRAVSAGANVLVSGPTHSGKTTVLNALLAAAPAHRVVTCEEVRELRIPVADWVALQTRDPGIEGTASVSLRDLVRESLRMRPDRVVVGEVRGPEALDLLLAMNCGIPATATVHANSASDAIDRMIGLPLLSAPNIAAEFVSHTLGSCLDLVVHLASDAGRRRVEQVVTVSPGPGRPVVGTLFHDLGHGLVRGSTPEPARWAA